ncbi:MAG: hypothetical protein LUO93_05065 [Methanomicrobiales archaeon]|nr:hypothetical protein [Methanomicrobiales archaeon]
MEPLTIFTFFAALGFVVWGYLVGIKRNLSLIPRYSPGRIKNERGYTLWIGYNLMGMGTLGGIDGLLQILFPDTHVSMFLAYAVIIVPAIMIRTIAGKRRYEAGQA